MLAGVHQYWLDAGMLSHFAHQRCDLHQVWTRANNVKNLKGFGHLELAYVSITFAVSWSCVTPFLFAYLGSQIRLHVAIWQVGHMQATHSQVRANICRQVI